MFELENNRPFTHHLWESKGYIFLLTILLLGNIYYITMSFELRLVESWLLPRLVLYTMLGLIMIELIRTLFRPYLSEVGTKVSQRTPDLIDSTDSDDEVSMSDELEGSTDYSIHPKDLTAAVLWVLAFIFALENIGFFVTIATFSLIYPLYYLESDTRERIITSVSSCIIITTSLWVLFIYVMQAYSMYEFGVLP